jgi:hypothetical protein
METVQGNCQAVKEVATNGKPNQAKLRSFRLAPKYKYGFEVPRDYGHAIRLDERNGNNNWQQSTKLECNQMDDYDTFTDLGRGGKPLTKEYKKIHVHLIFDIKHDRRHKAQCVADGHLTEVPINSVYSSVVSLRGLSMLIFLAELNQKKNGKSIIYNAAL